MLWKLFTNQLLKDKNMANEGDIIIVNVDGIDYETHIIDRVQRFIEKPNHWMLIQQPKIWLCGEYVDDLNTLAIKYRNKPEFRRDYMEMHMSIGYSVCGFCDIFPQARIINPLWEDDDISQKMKYYQLLDKKISLKEFISFIRKYKKLKTNKDAEDYFIENYLNND